MIGCQDYSSKIVIKEPLWGPHIMGGGGGFSPKVLWVLPSMSVIISSG